MVDFPLPCLIIYWEGTFFVGQDLFLAIEDTHAGNWWINMDHGVLRQTFRKLPCLVGTKTLFPVDVLSNLIQPMIGPPLCLHCDSLVSWRCSLQPWPWVLARPMCDPYQKYMGMCDLCSEISSREKWVDALWTSLKQRQPPKDSVEQ